jgi:hypothetical protein
VRETTSRRPSGANAALDTREPRQPLGSGIRRALDVVTDAMVMPASWEYARRAPSGEKASAMSNGFTRAISRSEPPATRATRMWTIPPTRRVYASSEASGESAARSAPGTRRCAARPEVPE